ncbi:MAG: ABC transporter permease subunit [Actinobacteria bacterium]|nr:ABC transporter permease subunit [Actinomycetota bacterium]
MAVVNPEGLGATPPVIREEGVRAGSPFARLVQWSVLIGCGLFFLAPLLTLARHSLQNVPAFLLGRETLFKKWALSPVTMAFDDPDFWPALSLSLKLAIGTVLLTLGLLVPTAVWTHLRVPRARSLVEFVTVLPYMIPPIALVAGIVIVKPHARWFLNSDYSLIPFYVVLALPFTYRSIDAGLRAIDLRTLVDASRSLGAGWAATLWRVLIPNLRTSIISASFLTAAVVVGEFTIADTLLKETLPRFQATFVGKEPQAGYALNLLALLVTTLLFVVLGVLTKRRDRSRRPYVPPAATVAPSTQQGTP